jgi:hypothetical protein
MNVPNSNMIDVPNIPELLSLMKKPYRKFLPNMVGLARAITWSIKIYQASWVATGVKSTDGYYDLSIQQAIRMGCGRVWYKNYREWERLIYILLANGWTDSKFWAEDILKYASGGSEVGRLDSEGEEEVDGQIT